MRTLSTEFSKYDTKLVVNKKLKGQGIRTVFLIPKMKPQTNFGRTKKIGKVNVIKVPLGL